MTGAEDPDLLNLDVEKSLGEVPIATTVSLAGRAKTFPLSISLAHTREFYAPFPRRSYP